MTETEILNKPVESPAQAERPNTQKRKQVLVLAGAFFILLILVSLLVFMLYLKNEAGKNAPADVTIARKDE